MSRRVVIGVLAVAILLTASCADGSSGAPVFSSAAITGDNSGGAIAFYLTQRMSDAHFHVEFYAQKISPEGDFLWGEKGIWIGNGDAAYYWNRPLHAVSDGTGGTIIIWDEPLPEPPYSQPRVAKIDSGGNVEWQTDIPSAQMAIKEAIPDGSGGVIIYYVNRNGSMSVLKIDAEGNLPWGEDGVSLDLGDFCTSDIASDNLGGIIVIGYGVGNICAQRVDSGGNRLWQTGGVEVCDIRGGAARVVGDGSGGAIIAYEYLIFSGDGKYGYSDSDIYAQRIDAEGNILWGPDGVPVCVEPLYQYNPEIVDDGAGGAIVFFVTHFLIGDYTSPAIHAQRIDADGHKLWLEDVQVWEGAYVSAIRDDSGGAISVWYSDEESEARFQKLDAAARKLWGPDGTTLTLRDMYPDLVISDSYGGVLMSLLAVKFKGEEVSQVSYYVQRVDAEGNVVWGDEGILLNP
jgi:hypothetical protein